MESAPVLRKRRRHWGCLTLFLIIRCPGGHALLTPSTGMPRLDTSKVTVLNLPKALEGFSVLHISDLNGARLGAAQENLRQALRGETFQAVALTGDMVGGGDTQPLMELLGILPKEVPVFLVPGLADPAPLLSVPHGSGEVKAPWVLQAEALGAIYLESPHPLEADGRIVWFCPGDLFAYDLPSARNSLAAQVAALKATGDPYAPQAGAMLRYAEHRLAVTESAIQGMQAMKPGDVIIALSHRPPGDQELSELMARVKEGSLPAPSLFLCGFFNNGQARIPGLGPLFIPPQGDGRGGFLPGDQGLSGLSVRKGFTLHVSPGLGVSPAYPLPLRLFNRPAITLLKITAQMTR